MASLSFATSRDLPTSSGTVAARSGLPISNGRLRIPKQLQTSLHEAFARFKSSDEGDYAAYYPALARVPRNPG